MKMLGITAGRTLFWGAILAASFKLHQGGMLWVTVAVIMVILLVGFYGFYRLYQSCEKDGEGC